MLQSLGWVDLHDGRWCESSGLQSMPKVLLPKLSSSSHNFPNQDYVLTAYLQQSLSDLASIWLLQRRFESFQLQLFQLPMVDFIHIWWCHSEGVYAMRLAQRLAVMLLNSRLFEALSLSRTLVYRLDPTPDLDPLSKISSEFLPSLLYPPASRWIAGKGDISICIIYCSSTFASYSQRLSWGNLRSTLSTSIHVRTAMRQVLAKSPTIKSP